MAQPPLIPFLVFLSFKLFRTNDEWSARLVPIFFSIASLFVLYSLVKKVWTTQTALLACLMAAVMPMATLLNAAGWSDLEIAYD